jgi:putative ABC transport system substrate-binding protein
MLLALNCPAEAQQSAKVAKIGWLFLRPAEGGYGRDMTLRALRDLGYMESKNISFEYRHADNKLDRLPALADELVGLKVDVILAASTNAALAAKAATKTIPIVFVSTADPVVAGLVDSLARPGENLTGFTRIAAVSAGKRLELLKEIIPKLSRVAVLWNPGNPGSEEIWKEGQLPARALGLQLHSMEVSSAEQLERAFREAIKARSAALAVTLSR